MASLNGGKEEDNDNDNDNGFKKEIRDLEEMLSKLNPMAEEFIPNNQRNQLMTSSQFPGGGYTVVNNFFNGNPNRRVYL